MKEKRFLIYGAGAMGSLFGGLLSTHYPTYLIGRDEHIRAIRKNGLGIDGKTSGIFRPNGATGFKDIKNALGTKTITHCFLFTKAYDTEVALDNISRECDIIDSRTILISLQNGMDNEKKIFNKMPDNPLIGGYTCHGAIHERAGHITHSGEGATIIGPYNAITMEGIRDLAEALAGVGIIPTVKANIEEWIFKKVMINAAINPLTALLEMPNGKLLACDETKLLMRRIIEEGCGVAKKMSINISADAAFEMARDVIMKTEKNLSSMLQDIKRGKNTEIDSINGAICQLGEMVGTHTPVNSTIYNLVRAKEKE